MVAVGCIASGPSPASLGVDTERLRVCGIRPATTPIVAEDPAPTLTRALDSRPRGHAQKRPWTAGANSRGRRVTPPPDVRTLGKREGRFQRRYEAQDIAMTTYASKIANAAATPRTTCATSPSSPLPSPDAFCPIRSARDPDDVVGAVRDDHRFPTTAANLVGAVRCSILAQAASAVNGPNVQHVPSWRSTSTTQYSVTWRLLRLRRRSQSSVLLCKSEASRLCQDPLSADPSLQD